LILAGPHVVWRRRFCIGRRLLRVGVLLGRSLEREAADSLRPLRAAWGCEGEAACTPANPQPSQSPAWGRTHSYLQKVSLPLPMPQAEPELSRCAIGSRLLWSL